jgi:uncharacterized protein YbbC (DUF1343 family)
MSFRFLPGIDALLDSKRKWIKDRRIGLVSHPAAVNSRGVPAAQLILAAGGRLTALFGPEHGFFGTETAGQPVKTVFHPRLHIPVYSLYGKHRRPSAEMLADVDALVFDLQDLGARPYTYVSTLRYVLESAAQLQKQVIVADRPIPLPRIIDGPVLEEKFSSFVGCIPAPMCYGMTPAETALWLKHVLAIDLDLEVAKMRGYYRQGRRGKDWPPWIPPSPGIRSWETGYCYLATVFAEALPAVNIGRGSDLVFQVFSVPGIKSRDLCRRLNRRHLAGVTFYPHPYKLNDRNQIFDGVRIKVSNPDVFHPVAASVVIISVIQEIGGLDLVWRWPGTRADFFDKLYGTDLVRRALQAGEPAEGIIREWQKLLARFNSIRRRFLLYKRAGPAEK